MTSRSLPHSLESEKHLLSSCLLDGPDVITRCIVAGIQPDSFYDAKHGIVFAGLLDLYAAQKPTEIHVLASHLAAIRQLDSIGGHAFLAQVSHQIPTTAQAAYFIAQVRELAMLREIIHTRTATIEDCYNFTGEIDNFMVDISAREGRVTTRVNTEEETIQKVAADVLKEIRTPKAERHPDAGGVSWGLVDLDKSCGKLQPGNLVVIAGMPSSGKSALADQVSWKSATDGRQTLIFTYEMSKRDKAIRIAQQVSRLNEADYDNSPPDRQKQFTDAFDAIVACKTLHVFERDTTVGRLVARCRAFANRNKVGLIVVDFLQYLARIEPTLGRERSDEKLGRLTAAMKQIAGECGCPTILLSSLNREGYRDGNRPDLSHLKASGEIESDGDVVGILHWPKTNPATGDEQDIHDPMQNRVYVEFNQEKGRSKGVCTVGLSFDRRATRFDNYHR